MRMIAWSGIAAPAGNARLVDGAELARMQMVLDGEPFFDRDGLRSLIDKRLTVVDKIPVAFAFAAVSAFMVEMVVEAGQGDLEAARRLYAGQAAAREALMESVPSDGSANAHGVAAMMYATVFNLTVIDSLFKPESHRRFVAELSGELDSIKRDKARLKKALDTCSPESFAEYIGLEADVESLKQTKRDIQLVKSAAEAFTPRPEQRVNSSVPPVKPTSGAPVHGVVRNMDAPGSTTTSIAERRQPRDFRVGITLFAVLIAIPALLALALTLTVVLR